MATNDDMRERFDKLESRFDQLEKKVDQLPTKADWSGFATKADLSGFATKADLSGFATKADLSGFATKADLSGFATKADLIVFKDEIIKNFSILAEDAKVSVKKAAEGYAGTLDRIERDLVALNKKMDDNLSVHDQVLTNHVERIVALEQATGLLPK
ncbi:MAG: hypothetical protein ABI665_06200 [Vicinamibacterales bacterium]